MKLSRKQWRLVIGAAIAIIALIVVLPMLSSERSRMETLTKDKFGVDLPADVTRDQFGQFVTDQAAIKAAQQHGVTPGATTAETMERIGAKIAPEMRAQAMSKVGLPPGASNQDFARARMEQEAAKYGLSVEPVATFNDRLMAAVMAQRRK